MNEHRKEYLKNYSRKYYQEHKDDPDYKKEHSKRQIQYARKKRADGYVFRVETMLAEAFAKAGVLDIGTPLDALASDMSKRWRVLPKKPKGDKL